MVKFLRAHGRYGVGDHAVFSPDFEQRLVKDGFATTEEAVADDKKQPEQKRPEPGNNPQNRQTTVPGHGTKSK